MRLFGPDLEQCANERGYECVRHQVRGRSFPAVSGHTLEVDRVLVSPALALLLDDAGFAEVLNVYLVAQAAGMISHVPAGLGVFETAVFHLMPGDVPTPELAGALLLYRAVYYLLPLVLGAVLLLLVEAAFRRRQVAALQRWLVPLGAQIVPRVLALLERLGFSYVCVDQPAARVGGVAPIVAVTAPRVAIVRFHGQNVTGWDKRGASVTERFNYLYTPEELGAWVGRVKELATRAETVHAVFNNCVRNYAVLNAKDLAVLLAESPS